MSDVVYRAGLDDSAVKRGFREIEGASTRSAKEVRGSFESARSGVNRFLGVAAGFITLEKSISFARDALRSYDQYNLIAIERAERHGTALEKLKIGFGRDLRLIWRSVAGDGLDLVSVLDAIAVGLDNVNGSLYGQGSFYSSYLGDLRTEEAQGFEKVLNEQGAKIRRDLEVAQLKARASVGGLQQEADFDAEAIAIQERFENRMKGVNALITTMQKARSFGAPVKFDTGSLAEQVRATREAELLALDTRRQIADLERAQDDRGDRERLELEMRRLDVAERALELDVLRREGRDREVALGQVQLRFEEEISRVRRSGLDDAELRINRLRRLMGRALEAERADDEGGRRRGPGRSVIGVDAVSTRQALGVSIERVGIETRRVNNRLLERVNGTLERAIQRVEGRGADRRVII
jgi:hypothetical protein